jgi:hypothetical protein
MEKLGHVAPTRQAVLPGHHATLIGRRLLHRRAALQFLSYVKSPDDRVRTDRVDQAGVIILRIDGRLHHISVGRTYTATRVLILVQDLNITIVNAATGETAAPANTRSQ